MSVPGPEALLHDQMPGVSERFLVRPKQTEGAMSLFVPDRADEPGRIGAARPQLHGWSLEDIRDVDAWALH